MKPHYYMARGRSSERSYWEHCNANTLAGAKREATLRFGTALGQVLSIGAGDPGGDLVVVSRRIYGERWRNVGPLEPRP